MKQKLADLMPPELVLSTYTSPEPRRPKPPRAIKLGIRLGGIYKLSTSRGFLIVQVLQFRRWDVVVKEVEANRRFHVNPANLTERIHP